MSNFGTIGLTKNALIKAKADEKAQCTQKVHEHFEKAFNTEQGVLRKSYKHILITGGAGYIGSHMVLACQDRGWPVVVLDNLSTGKKDAIRNCPLVVGDVGDRQCVESVLRDYCVDAVIHFAASISVPESIEKPLAYYQNNTANTMTLLNACVNAGVREFIFSSTSAVYGQPESELINENTPCQPMNPYGWSKWMCEQILFDMQKTCDMRALALRYFNVVGADSLNRAGPRNPESGALFKVAAQAACGSRDAVMIYGTDYPTPDGTGIRDYIHVSDLVDAHAQALQYLRNGGKSTVINCGYGKGYSVREVFQAMQQCSGVTFKVEEGPRRKGDPAKVIADVEKIHRLIDWQPRFNDLSKMVASAYHWEQHTFQGKE